jgi:hypothetical protein
MLEYELTSFDLVDPLHRFRAEIEAFRNLPLVVLLCQERSTRRRRDARLGKMPTTLVRLSISMWRRSSGLVECSWQR